MKSLGILFQYYYKVRSSGTAVVHQPAVTKCIIV